MLIVQLLSPLNVSSDWEKTPILSIFRGIRWPETVQCVQRTFPFSFLARLGLGLDAMFRLMFRLLPRRCCTETSIVQDENITLETYAEKRAGSVYIYQLISWSCHNCSFMFRPKSWHNKKYIALGPASGAIFVQQQPT